MKVTIHYRNDPERDLTDPLPELGGRKFIARLYSGDVACPLWGTLFGEGWFNPPFPKQLIKFSTKYPVLPFVSFKWPFLDRACYIGFKLYGVDHNVYSQWLCGPEDIYPGSQALCLTLRPWANLKVENKV